MGTVVGNRLRRAAAGILLLALPALIFFLTIAIIGRAGSPATFRNPILDSGPDPWMTFYQGNYYFAATTWGPPWTGLTMRKSPTVAGLRDAEPVKIWEDWESSRCCNFWAPEFFLLDGPDGPRWYGYYTGGPSACCDNQRLYVIESAGTDPLGPYAFKGRLRDSIDDRTIDASILRMNGSLYLLFAGRTGEEQRVYIAPMSNPWTLSGERVLLSSPEYAWEKEVRAVNQGPVALQHGGRTFIIYSASYCGGGGYKLGMLAYTGGDPLRTESWVKSPEPVFRGWGGVFSPGHNTIFRSPDGTEDWIVYHANSSIFGACDMNRSPRIQPFTWNDDGTPNFGQPVPAGEEMDEPSGRSFLMRPLGI